MGRVSSHTVSGGRGRRAAVDFVVCFGPGEISCFFFPTFFFLERTRPAASMRPPRLNYLLVSTTEYTVRCCATYDNVFYEKLKNISCEYDRLNG